MKKKEKSLSQIREECEHIFREIENKWDETKQEKCFLCGLIRKKPE